MGYESRKLKLVEKRSTMREIDLTPYEVMVSRKNEAGEISIGKVDYDLKASIAGILFHPELKISGREAVKRDKLCEKVEASEGSVLLEESDWKKLVEAIESLPSVGRNDVKFVERILDAPEVTVDKK